MNRWSVNFVACGAVLAGLTANMADAQRVASVSLQAERAIGKVFDRLVTVRLENVPLKQALRALEVNAGVVIQYQGDALNPYAAPITVQATRAPLGSVLQQVLLGTSLRPMASAEDAITLRSVQGAELQGTIVGTVKHASTRQPVGQATVAVNGASVNTKTDASGAFRLVLAPGEYTLAVRAIGFAPLHRRITVSENGTVSAEILLDPSTSVLDEVIVTGTVVATERRAVTTPITVITAADIEKRGITRIDELFRGEVPGVIAFERGSSVYRDQPGAMAESEVYVRGSSGIASDGVANPLKTYVDGVELVDPAYLGTLDPTSIDRIEIITGPQAATIYGSGAMGGVMQIFTKRGSASGATAATLSLRYGILQSNVNDGKTPSHQHSLGVTGNIGPALSWSTNLSYNSTGAWQPGLFRRSRGASLGMTHTRNKITVGGSLSTNIGSNGTAGNSGALLLRAKMEDGTWWNGSFPTSVHFLPRISHSSAQTISVNANQRITPILSHSATIGKVFNKFEIVPEAPLYRGNVSSPEDTMYKHSSRTGDRTTLSYNATIFPVFTLLQPTLTIGANQSQGSQVNITGCTNSTISTTWRTCTTTATGLVVSKTVDDRSTGGFASLRLGVLNRLWFSTAVRLEHNPSYGAKRKIDWTPTNGATYTHEHGNLSVKLLGSYGRATRAPDPSYRREAVLNSTLFIPSSYIVQVENQLLRPERSRGPQGGVELYYGNLGSLTVNHYNQRVTDLIQNVVVDSILRRTVGSSTDEWADISQYQNVATVKQYGWEGTGSLNIQRVNVRGTWSWSESRVLYSYISTYHPGQSFKRLPTHTGNVIVTYAGPKTTMSFTLNAIGAAKAQLNWVVGYQSETSNARIKQYISRARADLTTIQVMTKGYMKSNMALSHRVRQGVDVTLNMTNVGNSFGSEGSSDSPVLGRQTLIGLRLRR